MRGTSDEAGDAEGSAAVGLGVALLQAGHVPGDVLWPGGQGQGKSKMQKKNLVALRL